MNASSAATSIQISAAQVHFGADRVLADVELSVPAGSTMVLLGPSGCGKTTLLRAVAGLEPLTGGEIRLGDRVVSAPGAPGVMVPAEQRNVGMVFQDWALFPHLSVRDNVAFGLRGADCNTRVVEMLRRVGMVDFQDRMPHTLSGGQQQRVALARALAPAPSVLLLDEPFSNLDATLRAELRAEVRQLLRDLDMTAIFVTHDLHEAFVMGDQVALIRQGQIQQVATAQQLYHCPVTPWVAQFTGDVNVLSGPLRAAQGGAEISTVLGTLPVASPDHGVEFEVGRLLGLTDPVAIIRPEECGLSCGEAEALAGKSTRVSGELRSLEFAGHSTLYSVAVQAQAPEVLVRMSGAPVAEVGQQVHIWHRGGAVSVLSRT